VSCWSWAWFYDKYPNGCYLTAADKQLLMRSPFFFEASGKPVAGNLRVIDPKHRPDPPGSTTAAR
jgi:hypothetical protein